MHEEPLHLVPHELREEIYREFGVYIEGDLCPACRQMVKDQYGGRMEDVAVQRIAFSEKNRVGIGTFTPSDPKSQDISELTGSVNPVTGVIPGGCRELGPGRAGAAGIQERRSLRPGDWAGVNNGATCTSGRWRRYIDQCRF